MKERASASEVCSSEGQEGELLHKKQRPNRRGGGGGTSVKSSTFKVTLMWRS